MQLMGWLQRTELLLFDLARIGWAASATAQDRFSLVLITEQDIRDLGHWPLTDAELGTVLESLQAGEPAVIGLDIYRDLPIPPGSELLDSTLGWRQRVVGVKKFPDDHGDGIPAPKVLEASGRYGFNDLVLDTDGGVRRGLLFMDDGEQVSSSFVLQVALIYLSDKGVYPSADPDDPAVMRLGDRSVPPLTASSGAYQGIDAAGYQFLADMQTDLDAVPRIPLMALLAGEVDKSLVQGRMIMIGAVATSTPDIFKVPVARTRQSVGGLPGILLHTALTDQLVRQGLDAWPVVGVLPDAIEWVNLLFWALIGAFVSSFSRNATIWLLLAVLTVSLPLALEWLLLAVPVWVPGAAPSVTALTGALIGLALSAQRESAERKMLWQLFSRHVSPEVADEILKHKDEVLDAGRVISRSATATVLFSDLKDFTPTCEAHSPEWVMSWLGRHTERMTEIVMAHGGVVDDYFGDAIKANFGVPLSSEDPDRIRDSALAAIACALEMREALQPLNDELMADGMQRIQMRIGIETGSLVSGTLGSRNRQKFTTVGDTVNTAARLQTLSVPVVEAKARDCTIIIGPETRRWVEGHHQVLPAGQVRVKGKSEVLDAWYL